MTIHPAPPIGQARCRSNAGIVVEFSTTSERPTMTRKSNAAHNAIVSLLKDFLPAERETILLNVCTSVADLQGRHVR